MIGMGNLYLIANLLREHKLGHRVNIGTHLSCLPPTILESSFQFQYFGQKDASKVTH
jgi:hypothetical protein